MERIFFGRCHLGKEGKAPQEFKGIKDNTRFLKGGQYNNPLENDMEKNEELDGAI